MRHGLLLWIDRVKLWRSGSMWAYNKQHRVGLGFSIRSCNDLWTKNQQRCPSPIGLYYVLLLWKMEIGTASSKSFCVIRDGMTMSSYMSPTYIQTEYLWSQLVDYSNSRIIKGCACERVSYSFRLISNLRNRLFCIFIRPSSKMQ
jgi:hypothetical protein